MRTKHKGSIWTGVVIAVLFLFVVGTIGVSAFMWFAPSMLPQWLAERQAAQDTVEKTNDADWALNNYEWFKQQKQDIDAQKRQIKNTEAMIERMGCDNMTDAGWQEQRECNQLYTELRGQKQMYETLVADYESRRSQVHRSQWFNDLPYDMEQKFWTGDGR